MPLIDLNQAIKDLDRDIKEVQVKMEQKQREQDQLRHELILLTGGMRTLKKLLEPKNANKS